MLKLLRSFSIVLACTLTLGSLLGVVHAADSSTQSIAQTYGTDTSIRQGMIVGLKPGDATKVIPLTRDNVKGMQGVVIGANDAALTLSGDSASAQVYVAAFGRYDVLVSTQNGNIHSGDYISISALDGIGMKADDTQSTVLGKAAADFTGAGSVSTATLKKSNGSSATVAIGSIPVDIGIANNPNQGRGLGELPGFLQIATNSIADKPVSAPRTYLSLAILLLTVVIAGSLLYSGVRSSIVSIGRNPLAKRYIIRGLMQVILTSIIIFIVGLFAVYLLLRL